MLASSGFDNQLLLWDAASGKLVHTLQRNSQPIEDLAFEPDSNTLVTRDNGGTVQTWDVNAGAVLRKSEESDKVANSIASPDGQLLPKWSSPQSGLST